MKSPISSCPASSALPARRMLNRRGFLTTLVTGVCFLSALEIAKAQIISQYVKTNSGSNPKGIEIWNQTGSTLDFATTPLTVEQGTNGGTPSTVVTVNSGSLASGAVIVIGTSDIGTYLTDQGLTSVTFVSYNFAFNGDDALVVKLNGVTTDVFGTPGVDPGTAWSGSGVSTTNQNIQLLASISSGATAGWAVPSTRFETVSTTPSLLPAGLEGFGIAPVPAGDDTDPPILQVLSPENTFAAALTNTALVITYDEPVIAGSSGSLTIRKTSDNSLVETVTLPSEQVSTSGSAGIVKLSTLLDAGTSYYVDVDAGFFTDAATNPAPAISGTTEWSFTTRSAPEVLISQYYEGAGSDRYIELKNLTSSPLTLDGYSVTAWSNSDPAGREGWKSGTETTTRITDLTGQTIPANGTFLIAEIGATAPAYAAANNDLIDSGGSTAINGDDSVVLYFSGVNPLGFTLAEVVDAISIAGTEGTDTSFYRLTNGPGFDFAPGSSILDYASVWGTKTNAEVDAAANTDEWYLKASQSIESLTLSLSPSSVAESAGLAASVATVTRSGSTSGAVFVTVASSNPSAAADEGLAGFVEIPDGEASATFNIDVTDNPWRVGDASVTFSVSAEGLLPDSADLTILDDPTDVPLPLVINEVDANTPGTDVDEFVEIYNNSSEAVSLDGVVLVLFNGNGDSSYNTVDLSGYSIPGNGFFVIGSASVPNVDLVAFTTNSLQNGADAVALYYGSYEDFPNGTPASNSNGVLLDALVYDNDNGDDTGLLAPLTPEQVQVNENINAASESESMSRASDGGAAFDSSLYVTQTPTPGATNVLPTATFASWAAENGIAGEPFDGDFDGDGISNGLEYAIAGLDPAQPDAAPGSFAAGVLSFTKRAEAVAAGDVSWQIEESTDLGIADPWEAVTPDTDDESAISYTLPTGQGKVFARLKVTQAP